MIKQLSGFQLNNRPKVLLLGNGINRLDDANKSWEAIVADELKNSASEYEYEKISSLPATMQIVVATKDHVNDRLKIMAEKLFDWEISDRNEDVLDRMFSLKVDTVLTTNYSMELERALGFQGNKASYSAHLKKSKEGVKSNFRLYQYYEWYDSDGKERQLWHIHGDAAKPSSMIMGHYFYDKHSAEVQKCAASAIRRYNICKKKELMFQPQSWVDQFLLGDVYIVGLGMYTCESDLWWLLCCKKRYFAFSHVYWYENNVGEFDERRLMFEAYEGKIRDIKTKNKNYKNFYRDVFQDIIDLMANDRTL